MGVVFSQSGIFNEAQSESYKKGHKAYFKLKKSMGGLFSADKQFHLFDSMVKPVVYMGVKFGVWQETLIQVE